MSRKSCVLQKNHDMMKLGERCKTFKACSLSLNPAIKTTECNMIHTRPCWQRHPITSQDPILKGPTGNCPATHLATDQRTHPVVPPCTTRPPMKQQWFLLLTPCTAACSWTHLQQAGRRSPPACCVTGVDDPRNGGSKMDPRFALAHNVFFLAGPIWGSILAPFFGSCRAQFLVTEVPKMVPDAFQKHALRNEKNLRRRPENKGRSTCANQELSDDAVFSFTHAAIATRGVKSKHSDRNN